MGESCYRADITRQVAVGECLHCIRVAVLMLRIKDQCIFLQDRNSNRYSEKPRGTVKNHAFVWHNLVALRQDCS